MKNPTKLWPSILALGEITKTNDAGQKSQRLVDFLGGLPF